MKGALAVVVILGVASVLAGVYALVGYAIDRLLSRGRRRRAAQHWDDLQRQLASRRTR
jgi:hypothetical protein